MTTNLLDGGELRLNFLQSYYTDVGIKRRMNQDSLAIFKADTDKGEVVFALVCDGMGGYQYGELASKTIIEAFEKWFKLQLPYSLYKELSTEQLRMNWENIVRQCNKELISYGAKHGIELGSTLTAGLFIENHYYIIHVGDSRAYEITTEGVSQITEDQSLVAEELRKGLLSEEEAKKDKRNNILLECVGITPRVNILFYDGTIKERATYLFCSDGFWHETSDEEYIRYLSGNQFENNKMIRMQLNYLVEACKQRGEKDNISVVGLIPFKEKKDE